MAAAPKPLQRVGKSSVIWAAAATVLLVASMVMLVSLRFGQDYAAEALEDSKRVEFDLDYDAQSNAIPQNLLGEPLDMATAKAMADLALAEQPSAPQTEPTPDAPQEPAPQEPAAAPADPEPAAPQPTLEPVEQVTVETQPVASVPDTQEPPAETTTPEPQPHKQPAPASAPPAVADTPVLAPVEKQTEHGIVPTIAPDGTKPWRYFAHSDSSYRNKPRIAVVVSGLGLAALSTEAAIALPRQVTLSFSPYGRQTTAAMAESARAAGHELMLDLPMQTKRFPAVDPGPYGMRKDLGVDENNARLAQVLTKARGYVGLLGTIADTLSDDTNLIVPIIRRLENHGLLFVAGHAQPPAGMFRIQRHASIPVLMTDIVLDDRITETAIRNQLARAEDRARNQGQALVVGHSYPLTVDLLAEWLKTLNEKGFTLVPVSALGEE
jgi:uncharacterized protein